jgi:DNA repair exonuclease SbcCD ATPase subunit
VSEISELRRRVERTLTEFRVAKELARTERVVLARAKQKLADALEAQSLLQHVAQAVQSEAHEQISRVVTHCLQTVFPDDGYSFRINFHRRRGKTDAQLVFVRNNVEIDPTTEDSGGAVAVAAFALRLACLMLATPKRRRLLVLDEPFHNVSADYVPVVAELLQVLARDLGVQIVAVTHNEGLKIGKVIHLEKDNDR